MSINPGNCGGSLASPDRKARRKLISGSRLSSIRTRPNPFPNLVPTASGRFSGRGSSGGGITRRKVSACIVVIIGAVVGINSSRWIVPAQPQPVARLEILLDLVEPGAGAQSVDQVRRAAAARPAPLLRRRERYPATPGHQCRDNAPRRREFDRPLHRGNSANQY